MLALGAESAADVGADHAHRVLGQAELLGNEFADVMRDLGGRVNHQFMAVHAAIGRGDGNDRARFERGARDAVIDQIALDHMFGAGKRRVHGGLIAALESQYLVARRLRMQLHCARCDRIPHVDHGRQRFPVDFDQFGGVERLVACRGHHHRDRLTNMARDAPRQGPARRVDHLRAVHARQDPQRGHRPDFVGGHVGAGKHRDDTGRLLRCLGADAPYPCMRMRRTHERAMQFTFEDHVRHIVAGTGEELAILAPQDGLADAFGVGCGSK